MRNLSRLVWSEGMYLGPHQFQAQCRYFEDSVQFAVSSLAFASYGLSGVELDPEALRNGTVSVLHARGILPDGLPFQMPDCDPLPEARNITELFSPVRDSLTVFLAIPARNPEGMNCDLDSNGANARYAAETRYLHDENTGRDEKPVRVGRKNIRLVLDTELTDGQVALPLARVMRDGTGHFVYDPHFIPPCIDIAASESLMLLLRRIIEILEEKSAALSGGSKKGSRAATAWSSEEVAGFWFLHSINSGLAPLRHLCFSKRGHPEEVFVELSRLAGALCTFGMDSHPRSLPLYDHRNLEACFDALEKHIRFHLEAVVPTNCISVPLSKAEDYFWAGPLNDQRCLGRSRWIFAIHSRMGEAELIAKTPQLVKVCSQGFVGKLVQRALPGMALTHLPNPPVAVAPRLETQYFGISRGGPCWDHIVQTRQVGVYVPGEIPDPEIELLVVLES